MWSNSIANEKAVYMTQGPDPSKKKKRGKISYGSDQKINDPTLRHTSKLYYRNPLAQNLNSRVRIP